MLGQRLGELADRGRAMVSGKLRGDRDGHDGSQRVAPPARAADIVADISGAKNLNWKPHDRTVRGCPNRFVTGYSRKRPGSGLRFNSNASADSAVARSAEAAATHERTDPLASYLRAGGAYTCTR